MEIEQSLQGKDEELVYKPAVEIRPAVAVKQAVEVRPDLPVLKKGPELKAVPQAMPSVRPVVAAKKTPLPGKTPVLQKLKNRFPKLNLPKVNLFKKGTAKKDSKIAQKKPVTAATAPAALSAPAPATPPAAIPQMVVGPDGNSYYVYFYPVASGTAAGKVTGPAAPGGMAVVPPFIPVPAPQSYNAKGGANNPEMAYYPYAPYPYPGRRPPRKKSKFWNAVDIGRRVLIILVVVAAVGYGAKYLLDLRAKSANFNKDQDAVTVANLESLRQLMQDYYMKNLKLPTALTSIDNAKKYSINDQTGEDYDFKITGASNYQVCTLFNADGPNYTKGYVCQPYQVSAQGLIAPATAFNPAQVTTLPNSGTTAQSFPGCTSPKPLLTANAKCNDAQSNCRKPMYNQVFGMSSVAVSNSLDRVAQTFTLPKTDPATMVTEFDPFIIDAKGGTACVAIYENEFDNEPLSGRELAEYAIPVSALKLNAYNTLFFNPIPMAKGKSYSFVFSVMDNNTSITFARGMELSSYTDGNAYYLKRSLEVCTQNCEPDLWVDRQDDLKFYLKFF
jgi:hypothetical protein